MSGIKKILILMICALLSSHVVAQEYPTKPIKIIVGYAPGGAVDLIARALAKGMSETLGQSIIVENKPGGGTNIATKLLIDSPSDGYVLMLAANALAANKSLYKPQPFDPETDVTPIALIGNVPVVLATTVNGKYANLADLMKAAKAKPDDITFGSPGNGATPHMAVKFFEQAAGISLKHVPYKGGSAAITDLLGGQIDLVATNMLEIAPQVKAGKVKILAVMSPKRSPLFPEVPTIAESGFPGFEAFVWYGLIAPAKTPNAITNKLYSAVEKALASKEMIERLSSAGGEVTPGPRAQLGNLIKFESRRYEKMVREANIQPD
jgi:tripartite-type tricarboxylate transporter receptor subunit TctC